MTDSPPPLIAGEQLGQRLGVTVRFVRRLVDEDRVPSIRIGKFVRFDPVQFDGWLRTGESSGARNRPGCSADGDIPGIVGRKGRLRQR